MVLGIITIIAGFLITLGGAINISRYESKPFSITLMVLGVILGFEGLIITLL